MARESRELRERKTKSFQADLEKICVNLRDSRARLILAQSVGKPAKADVRTVKGLSREAGLAL
jgi:hypothetical protein